MDAAEGTETEAYVTVSLLTGARTEELRALTYSHLDLKGSPDAAPPRPPSIEVWHSVREGGDTKTRLSRHTLRLPDRAVDALRRHREAQKAWRIEMADQWQEQDLVFCTRRGLPLGPANVRRSFRAVVTKAGLDDHVWTPREMRHSFVSLMSDTGVPLEEISRLVGHQSTTVTEAVYRKQLRPVLTEGPRRWTVCSGRPTGSLTAPTSPRNRILSQAVGQASALRTGSESEQHSP